jgi:hypothetical protein
MIKSILSAITAAVPQATAAKIIANVIIWGAEKLVNYSKTPHNNEFLDAIKNAFKDCEKKKNVPLTIESLTRKNFKGEEFIRSSTADKLKIKNVPTQAELIRGMKLADKAQALRTKIDLPMTITSGFSCVELNNAVGGSSKSRHKDFLAFDSIAKGLTPNQFARRVRKSGISIDKCLVEKGCVHIQIQEDESKNRNFFGIAKKVKGKWKVKPLK